MVIDTSRVFDLAGQEAFGRLSGDLNPMHLDPIEARRLSLGLVVHGVHALLWALEKACSGAVDHRALVRLSVVFRRPIRVDEPVEVVIKGAGAAPTGVDILIAGRRGMTASVQWGPTPESRLEVENALPPQREPRDLTFEQANTAAGAVPLMLDIVAAAELFPNLMKVVVPEQVAFLLALTRIVGMDCPGLHSVLGAIEVDFSRDADLTEPGVSYRAESADERFSLVQLAITSARARASVRTFVRPRPYRQPGMADVARHVSAGAFQGVRALVVGGSRGLGELASKLIAAGDGEVCITYRDGVADAVDVANQLSTSSKHSSVVRFDVLSTDNFPSEIREWRPNAVLYFASPRIDLNDGPFDQRLFQRFADYYVTGLARLVEQLSPGKAPIVLLYPSTIFIEAPEAGSAEYVAAKAAGEALCNHLQTHIRGLRVIVVRMPRMLTDQTAGANNLPSEDEHIEQVLTCLGPLMLTANGAVGSE